MSKTKKHVRQSKKSNWEVDKILPSGKRLHNYRKSPCLMGKSTISMAMASIAMFVYQAGYNSETSLASLTIRFPSCIEFPHSPILRFSASRCKKGPAVFFIARSSGMCDTSPISQTHFQAVFLWKGGVGSENLQIVMICYDSLQFM